jgi:hypothetical protein
MGIKTKNIRIVILFILYGFNTGIVRYGTDGVEVSEWRKAIVLIKVWELPVLWVVEKGWRRALLVCGDRLCLCWIHIRC